MEYNPLDSLSTLMAKGLRFTEEELRDITVDLLFALIYLHNAYIIHRVSGGESYDRPGHQAREHADHGEWNGYTRQLGSGCSSGDC